MLKAHHVMRRRVETLSPDMPMEEAIGILLDRGISGAPVVDAAGKLVGVLSQRDFMTAERDHLRGREPAFYRDRGKIAVALPDAAAPSRPVKEYMTREIIAVDEDAGIVEVARLMSDRRIHRVIVTRGAKVAGLISSLDVMRALADAFQTAPEPGPRRSLRRHRAGGRAVAKRKA